MGGLQMTWQPSLLKSSKRKQGAPPLGLRNLGNTCYLNSVLQCLTYTPPLANLCLQCFHSSICDIGAGKDKKRECPFCILEKRIARSLRFEAISDAPAKINSCLRVYAEHFRGGRQEDAHEFLRYVIDACRNTCLKLKKFQPQQGGKNKIYSEVDTGESVVKEIFGGALQSQVKCLSCGAESNKVDEIMDISLDIFHCSSLKESLHKFFQPEILEGNNKYKCENCKELVTATKQMSLLQAPNVLVIQLKRFEGIHGSKIDKPITFDDYLVLSRYISKVSQDQYPKYDLCGTIVHSGLSPDSGHYYAYIKDTIGHWYCCDDSSVTLSNIEEVLCERVYILFFSRAKQRPRFKTEVAVSGIMSQESKDHRKPIKTSLSLDKSALRGQDVTCEKDTLTNGNGLLKEKSGCLERQADINGSLKVSHSNNFSNFSSSSGPPTPCRNEVDVQVGSKEKPDRSSDAVCLNGPSILPTPNNNHSSSNVRRGFHSQYNNYSQSTSSQKKINRDDSVVADLCGHPNVEKECTASVSSMENGKAESTLKEKNDMSVSSREDQLVKRAKCISGNHNNENGSSVVKSFRRISVESNITRTTPESGNSPKAPDFHSTDFVDSISSFGKRKAEDNGSCFIMSKDDKSSAKLEALKKSIEQDADKTLRSCGLYEEVKTFMQSKKKLCQERGSPGKPDKRLMISEARKAFNNKILNLLEVCLLDRLKSFGLLTDPSGT